jgi:protein-S-isoprenylcysteine O-methyltransferase Ste14
MNSDQITTESSSIKSESENKGLSQIISGVVGVAGGALLVLCLDPTWPVAFGVVGICLASAIVFCFLWLHRNEIGA